MSMVIGDFQAGIDGRCDFPQQCPEQKADLKRAEGVKSGQRSPSVTSRPSTCCEAAVQEESELGQLLGLCYLGPWAAPVCAREAHSQNPPSPTKTLCIFLSVEENYLRLKGITIPITGTFWVLGKLFSVLKDLGITSGKPPDFLPWFPGGFLRRGNGTCYSTYWTLLLCWNVILFHCCFVTI